MAQEGEMPVNVNEESSSTEDKIAMNILIEMMRDGIPVGADVVSAQQLHDASWLEEEEVEEILGGIRKVTESMEDARAFIELAAKKATTELVEQDLRNAGLDPEESAETGRRIADRFVKKGEIRGGTMKVRTYDVLSQAVEDGVRAGWRRAHKHVDDPEPKAIQEHVEREVVNAICEWFDFE